MKITLEHHIKSVHKQLKDYKCEICVKIFSTKHFLTLHMENVHRFLDDNIHVDAVKYEDPLKLVINKKPVKYKCELCNLYFALPQSLKDHNKNIHEKEFQYQEPFEKTIKNSN